ncbi:hypothetical protein GCM10022403_052920 [Streptomyces coacervatus]|uniref:Uncharacterized protein n=1 Tax=Streptomyces coacervatus TaxID=647381 RepID=A0ABP7I947_9ACTN
MSEVSQPSLSSSAAFQHTLYAATLAAGAIPEPAPHDLPLAVIEEIRSPVAVEAVCEPWLSPSRGETYSCLSSILTGTVDRKPLPKNRAPTSLLLQVAAVNRGPFSQVPVNSLPLAFTTCSVPFAARYVDPTPAGAVAVTLPPAKNGFSGQIPVSSTPTTTPLPALSAPPRRFQTPFAPVSPSRCGVS